VRHRTGPVDGPVRDCLPNRAQMTVAAPGPLAHRTLSGAHRTVRCPLPTVGAAMRCPRIARSTVDAGDRWLTGQSVAPPDSPVNYSHVAPLLFSRAMSSPRTTHWRSGAPPDGPVIFSHTPLSSPNSGDFMWTSLVHRTLSDAPPDSPVCQTELRIGCIEPSFSLFLSSSLVTVSSTWITMLVHKTIHQV
jgi:hypothetical protein